MTTATPKIDNTLEKINLCFAFEFRDCLDLFGMEVAMIKTCCVMNYGQLENREWNYEKLVLVVRIPQTTQNLVISRSCFAEDDKEMYKDL